VQVVARLVPPKGMTLPFVSHGGTALVVSCLAVGLALGASRGSRSPSGSMSPSPLPLAPSPTVA
jgi:cell division protein FtsW